MKEWAQGKDEDPFRYNHGGVGTGVASILSASSARELAKRLRIRGKRGGFFDGGDGDKMQALAPISSVEMARDLEIFFLGDAKRPVTKEVAEIMSVMLCGLVVRKDMHLLSDSIAQSALLAIMKHRKTHRVEAMLVLLKAKMRQYPSNLKDVRGCSISDEDQKITITPPRLGRHDSRRVCQYEDHDDHPLPLPNSKRFLLSQHPRQMASKNHVRHGGNKSHHKAGTSFPTDLLVGLGPCPCRGCGNKLLGLISQITCTKYSPPTPKEGASPTSEIWSSPEQPTVRWRRSWAPAPSSGSSNSPLSELEKMAFAETPQKDKTVDEESAKEQLEFRSPRANSFGECFQSPPIPGYPTDDETRFETPEVMRGGNDSSEGPASGRRSLGRGTPSDTEMMQKMIKFIHKLKRRLGENSKTIKQFVTVLNLITTDSSLEYKDRIRIGHQKFREIFKDLETADLLEEAVNFLRNDQEEGEGGRGGRQEDQEMMVDTAGKKPSKESPVSLQDDDFAYDASSGGADETTHEVDVDYLGGDAHRGVQGMEKWVPTKSGGAPKSRFGRPKSGSKRGFEDWERKNLMNGVKKFGFGQWKAILAAFKFSPGRTPVNLKDLYRNMEKQRWKELEKSLIGKPKGEFDITPPSDRGKVGKAVTQTAGAMAAVGLPRTRLQCKAARTLDVDNATL